MVVSKILTLTVIIDGFIVHIDPTMFRSNHAGYNKELIAAIQEAIGNMPSTLRGNEVFPQ